MLITEKLTLYDIGLGLSVFFAENRRILTLPVALVPRGPYCSEVARSKKRIFTERVSELLSVSERASAAESELCSVLERGSAAESCSVLERGWAVSELCSVLAVLELGSKRTALELGSVLTVLELGSVLERGSAGSRRPPQVPRLESLFVLHRIGPFHQWL